MLARVQIRSRGASSAMARAHVLTSASGERGELKSDDHCTLSQTFALKCYITPISSTSDISLSHLQIRPRRRRFNIYV